MEIITETTSDQKKQRTSDHVCPVPNDTTQVAEIIVEEGVEFCRYQRL